MGAWVVSQYVSGAQIGGDLPIAYGYPYIKDTVLGKIYHLNMQTGRIQEILELCAEEPDPVLIEDGQFNASDGPEELYFENFTHLSAPTDLYQSYKAPGWMINSPIHIVNYKQLMKNSALDEDGILRNVKVDVILQRMTEDAIDKYLGSALAPANFGGINDKLFSGSNVDATYKKIKNGNNSSIRVTFVIDIANNSSQSDVSYLTQHVFSSMPTYYGPQFASISFINGTLGSFNYRVPLNIEVRSQNL